MARDLSAEELHGLLGAYALDALPPDEREQIERYLDRSPRARTEVAEFRETAALLAHAGTDAPPGLWDRIAHELDEEPPALRLAGATGSAPPRTAWPRRVAVAAGIAAASIAIVLLGVQVLHQGDQIDELEAGAAGRGVLVAAEAASNDPDARRVALESDDGTRVADLVYLPDGSGYLLDDTLGRLPAGRTYQLWALVDDGGSPRAISAGVLGPDPGVSAFRFDGDVAGFLVTEEDSPGVESSQNAPILRGEVA